MENISEIEFDVYGKQNNNTLQRAKDSGIRHGFFTEEQYLSGEIKSFRSDYLIKPLMEVYSKVCKKEKISAIDLNDSLWAIGSNVCRGNDEMVCKYGCKIGCDYRPASDKDVSYFFSNTDKRKVLKDTLFD